MPRGTKELAEQITPELREVDVEVGKGKTVAEAVKKIGDVLMADIVDTAVGAGSLKTLVAAVTAVGFVETLKSAGSLTVLAPADTAFAKLSAGTVESLVKPEAKATLTGILTYHVIAGSKGMMVCVSAVAAD